MNFAAIDFETANGYLGNVCAVGIIIVEKGQVVDKFSKLVRPKEFYFDSFNVKIHGITEELVEKEPEFFEIWPEVLPLLEGRILIAHNASFDMSVLQEVLRQYALSCPNFTYCCTVQIARKTWPELMNHKLKTVAEYLGITFKHHDALEDALACAHIAIKACELYGTNTIEELADKIHINIRTIGSERNKSGSVLTQTENICRKKTS